MYIISCYNKTVTCNYLKLEITATYILQGKKCFIKKVNYFICIYETKRVCYEKYKKLHK